MNTFSSFLSNTLGGILVGCIVAAARTAWAFRNQALTFVRAYWAKPRFKPPYALHLAAGIWLSSTGTVLILSDGLLIAFGLTSTPAMPGATPFGQALAMIGNTMIAAGYCLHLIAWHAVSTPQPGKFFPWGWSMAVGACAVAGALVLWQVRA